MIKFEVENADILIIWNPNSYPVVIQWQTCFSLMCQYSTCDWM